MASNQITIQPLSAPSGLLHYIDYQYNESKMEKRKRGRKSMMRRFKIKYTNTKGVVKTRNIKATSEEKAMGEIKDMSQHHYTIVESLEEESDPDEKILIGHKDPGLAYAAWVPVVTSVVGKSNMDAEKINWLSKYAASHAAWESDSYNGDKIALNSTYGAYTSSEMPIEMPTPVRVFSKTVPLSAFESPSSEEKKN